MTDNSKIFRKESLDKINSPEQLNKYIKTTNPSIWVLLGAIIIFLCGVIFWATTGRIKSYADVGCRIKEGNVYCVVKEEDFSKIKKDSYIEINKEIININSVDNPSQTINEEDAYLYRDSALEEGGWFVLVKGQTNLNDGTYKAKVIFEEISPITFIIN